MSLSIQKYPGKAGGSSSVPKPPLPWSTEYCQINCMFELGRDNIAEDTVQRKCCGLSGARGSWDEMCPWLWTWWKLSLSPPAIPIPWIAGGSRVAKAVKDGTKEWTHQAVGSYPLMAQHWLLIFNIKLPMGYIAIISFHSQNEVWHIQRWESWAVISSIKL